MRENGGFGAEAPFLELALDEMREESYDPDAEAARKGGWGCHARHRTTTRSVGCRVSADGRPRRSRRRRDRRNCGPRLRILERRDASLARRREHPRESNGQ